MLLPKTHVRPVIQSYRAMKIYIGFESVIGASSTLSRLTC